MKIKVNRHTCTYLVMNKKGGRIQLQISREWSMTVNSLMNALPLNNIIRQDRICRKAFPESEPQAKNGTTIICNFTLLYLGWESLQLLSKVWIFMEFSIGHHWSQGVEMKYSVNFLWPFDKPVQNGFKCRGLINCLDHATATESNDEFPELLYSLLQAIFHSLTSNPHKVKLEPIIYKYSS
jgi:hypothetical protein